MFSFRYKLVLLAILISALTLGSALFIVQNALNGHFYEQSTKELERGQYLLQQLFDQRQQWLEQQLHVLTQNQTLDTFLNSAENSLPPDQYAQLSGDSHILLVADKTGAFLHLSEQQRALANVLQANSIYHEVLGGVKSSGLLFLSKRAYQISGEALLDEQQQVRGAVFIGTLLDSKSLEFFKLVTGLDIVLFHRDQLFLHTSLEFLPTVSKQVLSLLHADAIPHLRHFSEKNVFFDYLSQDDANLQYLLKISNPEETFYPSYALLRSQAQPELFQQTLQLQMILAGGVTLLLSIFISALLSKQSLSLINHLRQATEQVERDNYQFALKLNSRDEFAALGESFSHMLRSLQEKQELILAMEKLISRELAQDVLRQRLRPDGESKELTVLSAAPHHIDALLKGFTAWETLTFINNYFTRMNYAILANEGIVDQFHGEHLRALFGLSERARRQPIHAALQAAQDLREAVVLFNLEIAAPAGREVKLGIGLHAGILVTGHIGAEDRQTYSIIGEGVNLAGHLQRLTLYYGVGILISEPTYDALLEESPSAQLSWQFRQIDKVQFGSKRQSMKLYEVLPQPVEQNVKWEEHLQSFEEARELLENGHLRQATQLFESLQDGWPEDRVTQTLLTRCRRYLDNTESYARENVQGAYLLPEL